MVRVALLGSLLGAAGCEDPGGSSVARSSAPVVYGTDDRLEVYEVPAGVHRSLAESAVAMQTDIDFLDTSDPSAIEVTYGGTLGGTEDLCTDVAFQDQPDPGYCSGTLIDERHLLTAGHCVETDADCTPQYPWVFGYYYEGAGALRPLTADDVYECVAKVVYRNDLAGDYAIIELDRPVVGHAPAPVRTAPSVVPDGTALTMIGHPNGIPMKVAGNATVLGFDGQELRTDLDAFYGNSGSGVFDDGGEVVGILVSGSPRDYRRRSGGMGCSELVVLSSGEDFENLTPVGVPIAELCAGGTDSPLCGSLPDGGMPAPEDAGMPPMDGGGAEPDAGSSPRDQGVPGADAGAGADAGEEPALGGGGCSCSVEQSPAGGAFALAFFALALSWRRRPRRARRRDA